MSKLLRENSIQAVIMEHLCRCHCCHNKIPAGKKFILFRAYSGGRDIRRNICSECHDKLNKELNKI